MPINAGKKKSSITRKKKGGSVASQQVDTFRVVRKLLPPTVVPGMFTDASRSSSRGKYTARTCENDDLIDREAIP